MKAHLVVLLSVVLVPVKLLTAGPVYGDLKQSDVPGCEAIACGPVAAVNSFVFLQTKYPAIYGAALVGLDGDQPPPLHWEILAAEILGGSQYMGTCCSIGTPIEKFIMGKQGYIEDHIPGVTSYMAQIDIPWRPDKAGSPDHPVDKPDYVQDSTSPTLGFLRQEITDGEDVELLLVNGSTSHYVTLVSVGPQEDGVGDMNFVDPITGKTIPDGATYQIIKQGFGSHLNVTYTDPGTNSEITAVIAGAVSESPVPEPSTAILGLLGVLSLVGAMRRAPSCQRIASFGAQ
jgi:hypothetical protein